MFNSSRVLDFKSPQSPSFPEQLFSALPIDDKSTSVKTDALSNNTQRNNCSDESSQQLITVANENCGSPLEEYMNDLYRQLEDDFKKAKKAEAFKEDAHRQLEAAIKNANITKATNEEMQVVYEAFGRFDETTKAIMQSNDSDTQWHIENQIRYQQVGADYLENVQLEDITIEQLVRDHNIDADTSEVAIEDLNSFEQFLAEPFREQVHRHLEESETKPFGLLDGRTSATNTEQRIAAHSNVSRSFVRIDQKQTTCQQIVTNNADNLRVEDVDFSHETNVSECPFGDQNNDTPRNNMKSIITQLDDVWNKVQASVKLNHEDMFVLSQSLGFISDTIQNKIILEVNNKMKEKISSGSASKRTNPFMLNYSGYEPGVFYPKAPLHKTAKRIFKKSSHYK